MLALGLAALGLPVSAAGAPAGESLLPAALAAFQPGGNAATDARVKTVRLSGQPFPEALQVATLKRPPYPWNITLAAPTTGPIHKGDVLFASVSARRIASRQETGEALLELVVEGNSDGHHKLLELASSVGPEWTPVRAPFVADADYQAGAAQEMKIAPERVARRCRFQGAAGGEKCRQPSVEALVQVGARQQIERLRQIEERLIEPGGVHGFFLEADALA